MRTLVCTSPRMLEYASGGMPDQLQGNVIIKIKKIGICGTDLHAFEGTQPYFTYPRILGHELSGELVDNTNAPDFKKGEAVTFIPYFNCGHCIACRNGLSNCCANLKVFGVHIDGGMREYVSVPADKLIRSEELNFEELALVEPFAIGAHAVRRAEIKSNEFVVVVGVGPIGLATIDFAFIAGAKVIAIDVNDTRLQFCQNNLPVRSIINATNANAFEKVRDLTSGDMASIVIDATGNLKAINDGIKYLAHGGKYVLVGLQKEKFSFSHPEFHKREATLMSSRNALPSDFKHVVACIKSKHVNPLNYITQRVAFEEVKDHFESWLNPQNGVIKAMIEIS